MVESVACPDCQARLELPALPHGQTVQCPRCAHTFQPPSPRPTPRHLLRGVDVSEDVAPSIDLTRWSLPEALGAGWKTPAAMIALTACLLSYLLQLYVNFERFTLLRRELAGQLVLVRFPMGMDPWSEWETLFDDARMIHHLTFWPAAVLFLIWLHQASGNAWKLRAKDLQFSPIAVLSFLVPLLNLVWPYFMIQEIWRASHPRAVSDPLAWKNGPSAIAIRLWWAGLLAISVLAVFNRVVSANRFNTDEQCLAALFACGANVCMIATLALSIYIIRDIHARQSLRHARLCELSTNRIE